MAESRGRDTPVTFSPDEAAKIRELFASFTNPLPCPRCGKSLQVGSPIAGGGTVAMIWEIRCHACSRSLILEEFPKPPRMTK